MPRSIGRYGWLHAAGLAALSAAILAGSFRPAGAAAENGLPDAAERAADSIRVSDLRAHLLFMASDELQGRAVGTPGNALAELYLSSTFDRLGLSAGGEQFYQPFALYSGRLGPDNRLNVERRNPNVQKPYSPGPDFSPLNVSASGDVSGDIVFAGYGISAPELAYDDYAGLDARGKVVLVIAHEPEEDEAGSRFDGAALSAHAESEAKLRAAQEHGAIGVLIAADALQHSSRRRLGDLRSVWPEKPSPREMAFARAEIADAVHLPAASISTDVADDLLAQDGRQRGAERPKTVDAAQKAIDAALRAAKHSEWVRAPSSFPLPGASVALTIDIVRTRTIAHNVIAYIEGADPTLKHESVVLGAHLDHDGTDEERRIYNGADDNGSGTVALLEVAEAFAKAADAGFRPARTVVFAAWNAEEKGLFGSDAFVRHPLPSGTTPIANINLDMIGRNEDLDPGSPRFSGFPATRADSNRNSMHLLGYSYSTDLTALAKEANQSIGLEIKTDYDTGAQRLLRRSDHWSFLEHQIPALFFTTGLHPDYHTPQDDVEKINFEKLEKIARLTYRTLWYLSSRTEKPRFIEPGRAATAPH